MTNNHLNGSTKPTSAPTNIEFLGKRYIAEWRRSCVSNEIIEHNVQYLSGEYALEAVLGQKLEQCGAWGQQFATGEVQHILDGKDHIEGGGWWVSGLDPLNNWERMEWGQFKPDAPRPNPEKPGRVIKYESPAGQPARALFLATPDPDYWPNVLSNPKVPIVITEGAKKAGCLLTAGLAAVAVVGFHMAIRKVDTGAKDPYGKPIKRAELIPDLLPFAQDGRVIVLAFDQDSNPRTRERVERGLDETCQVLHGLGAVPKVARWKPAEGKGIDDWAAKKEAIIEAQRQDGKEPDTTWEQQVRALVDGTEPWLPPEKQYTQIVFDRLYANGRYICVDGVLHQWDNNYYRELKDSAEIRRISEFLDTYATRKNGRKGYHHAKASHAKEALEWVKGKTAIDERRVNPPGMLNLTNGVLVLDWKGRVPTWHLEPHDQHYFTYQPVYPYNPTADPTYCDRLLDVLTPGEREIFLRTIAAALDLPAIRARRGRAVKGLFLWGSGSNGKDTLREAVRWLFADKGMTSAGLGDFAIYDRGRKFPLAKLQHSRVNWASENSDLLSIDRIEVLKQLISGDSTLSIERKGKEEFDITPTCILLFNINGTPNLTASSEAILSRVAIIKLGKTFSQNPNPAKGELKADPRFRYDQDWLQQTVVPALLNRVLTALQSLATEGIDYSATQDTLEEVQRSNCHLFQFCSDTGLGYDPDGEVKASEVWEKLEAWYIEQGALTIDSDKLTGQERSREWSNFTSAKGDTLVKGQNQITERFTALFPKVKVVRKYREDKRKKIPWLVGLAFLPHAEQFSDFCGGGVESANSEAQNPGVASDSEPHPSSETGVVEGWDWGGDSEKSHPSPPQSHPSFESGVVSQDAHQVSLLSDENPKSHPTTPDLKNHCVEKSFASLPLAELSPEDVATTVLLLSEVTSAADLELLTDLSPTDKARVWAALPPDERTRLQSLRQSS